VLERSFSLQWVETEKTGSQPRSGIVSSSKRSDIDRITDFSNSPGPAILYRTIRRGIGWHGHKTEEFYSRGVFASG
jgi:hypothetical protein